MCCFYVFFPWRAIKLLYTGLVYCIWKLFFCFVSNKFNVYNIKKNGLMCVVTHSSLISRLLWSWLWNTYIYYSSDSVLGLLYCVCTLACWLLGRHASGNVHLALWGGTIYNLVVFSAYPIACLVLPKFQPESSTLHLSNRKVTYIL